MKRVGPLAVLLVTSACNASAPSIAAYCAAQADAGRPCVEHWSDAQASWDQFCTAAQEQYPTASFRTCQGADVVALSGTDTSQMYFYDSTSGMLVGIKRSSPVGDATLAGTIPNIDLSLCATVGSMLCIRP